MMRDWICTDNHSIRSKKDDQSKEKQPCEGFYRLIGVIFLKHCNFLLMIRLDYDNILSDSKKKLSAMCNGLAAFTFADISQGHDITYRDLVNRLIDKKS